MNYTNLKVLLDSTYILPSFGIEVEGISDEHLIQLRQARIKGKIKFYCSPVVWVEILGKVYRESKRLKINVEDVVEIAVTSLLESGFYEWIQPSSNSIILAFKLRMLGHKDNIDNILYAISKTNNLIFLTMDDEFKEFLSKHGHKTNNLIDHISLLNKLKK